MEPSDFDMPTTIMLPDFAIPTDKYMDIPHEYVGKTLVSLALDDSGYEIHFKDGTKLIFEDHTSDEAIFAFEEEDILYFVVTTFYGVKVTDMFEHWKLETLTSRGPLVVRVYGAKNVRCTEMK